ncbi:MAG: hypothetical protein WAU36_14400 [Cyclobacteriaceae bacterium]
MEWTINLSRHSEGALEVPIAIGSGLSDCLPTVLPVEGMAGRKNPIAKKSKIGSLVMYCPQAGRAHTFCIAKKVCKNARQKDASPLLPSHPRLFARPAHYLILLRAGQLVWF